MQSKVRDFHRKFGSTVNDVPAIPSDEDRKLRLRLIREEFEELAVGMYNKDLVEIADAIGDLMYVVLGTAVTYGIDIEPIFDEIHKSNMKKAWPDGSVRRREDGKVLKAPGWRPPNLRVIIAKQQKNKK